MGICVSVIKTESPEFPRVKEISPLTSERWHSSTGKDKPNIPSHNGTTSVCFLGFYSGHSRHEPPPHHEGVTGAQAPGTAQPMKKLSRIRISCPNQHPAVAAWCSVLDWNTPGSAQRALTLKATRSIWCIRTRVTRGSFDKIAVWCIAPACFSSRDTSKLSRRRNILQEITGITVTNIWKTPDIPHFSRWSHYIK